MTDERTLYAGNAEKQLRAAEKEQRSIAKAIELVLSFGDFQKQVGSQIDSGTFIRQLAGRINEIIKFDLSAVFFVDQITSDLQAAACLPPGQAGELKDEFESLVEQGYTAWALREPRGIVVYSPDGRYRAVLHPIATSSRIRGLFMGLQPVSSRKVPVISLQVLTLALRNAANTLESLEYLEMFKRQNDELHTQVDQKVGELRRRDTQLLNAQKMDAIATLAGGVAHKFNNALFALTGNLDLLRLGITDRSEMDTVVERMTVITRKMADLTQKLLAYARGGKYMPETISLNVLVSEALAGLKKNLDKGIELSLDLPGINYFVQVDVTQMQLSFQALVTNAVEALDGHGCIRIVLEKEFISEPPEKNLLELAPGEYAVLKVSDNGRGMDASTLSRVFEPFFSTKFQGRGLSLPAVHGIAKNHHGSVAIESEPGRGTTVRIYLPMAK